MIKAWLTSASWEKKLSRSFLLLIILFLPVSITPFAQADQEHPITIEGELANSVEIDFIDDSLVTETGFVTELEWEDNLSLDVGLITESESEVQDTSKIELDLEVLPDTEEELDFYLETDLAEFDNDETELGIETTFRETDYELGIDLNENEKNLFLDFYRWFDLGFSLRGGVELSNGPEFKNSSVAVQGVPISINDVDWDLSGELEATLEESLFGETEHVKLSFSLENEKVDYFRFPKKGEGVSLYQLTPLDSGDYTIVLYNSGEELNLEGWSIGSGGIYKEISKKLVIQPEQKREIQVHGNLVNDKVRLQIRNPDGEVKDTWKLPRFYFGNEELFRRLGSLEREIEISLEDNEFDELAVNWDLQIPTGSNSDLFGVFGLDHTGDIKKAKIGHRGPRIDLDISLLDEEIDINYYPRMRSVKFQSEVGLELNTDGEFETVFEIDQELGSLELANALAFYSDPATSEIELEQVLEWEQFELELAYLFVDSEFAEFGVNTEFIF